jgi:acetyl-CoA decarbonylase/synthase complex subunit gamma
MDAALAAGLAAERPLVHAATPANWEAMAAVAKKHGCPLVIQAGAGDAAGLAELSEQVRGAGVEDLVLDPGTAGLVADLSALTQLRRLALKKGARALGFPIFSDASAPTWRSELVRATQAVAKYAGVIVLEHLEPAELYALITLRQNIYTDPQKPIQVEPKLYEIGAAGPDSPVLITTNFSLTYFSVSGEVEGAGVPAWLLVADSDGQSVLTGWAAGKFDAEKIAKTVKDTGIADKISHRKLVIPGHVAGLSGEVEEELPGWQIMVGPRDAVDIPNYLKNVWGA